MTSVLVYLYKMILIDLFTKFLQSEQSFMTFEGAQLQGSEKIGEKLAVSLKYPFNCHWVDSVLT